MPDYRRAHQPGSTYFFTVVTNQRRPILLEPVARKALRKAFHHTVERFPFQLDAICLLPDHLHCIWTLPENDADFSTRWKLVKASFSRQYLLFGGKPGPISASKVNKGELGIWQRRFWEHLIRNTDDLNRHLDYLHYNPVKHGLAGSVAEWPWSSFHRYVRQGYYAPDWGCKEQPMIQMMAVGE